MTHGLEGLIFSSVLLANSSHRVTVLPVSRGLPNIVLHFLGNGLFCGEVIRPIGIGEALLRHWSLGDYAWRHTKLARWWCYKDGATQASILFDSLKPSDDYVSPTTLMTLEPIAHSGIARQRSTLKPYSLIPVMPTLYRVKRRRKCVALLARSHLKVRLCTCLM